MLYDLVMILMFVFPQNLYAELPGDDIWNEAFEGDQVMRVHLL